MEQILLNIAYGVSIGFILIISIFVHEFGHGLMLGGYNNYKKINFYWNKKKFIEVGDDEDYEHLSRGQLFNVYIAGIGLGLIPLAWYVENVRDDPFTIIFLFGLYGYFISEDLINIWRYCIRNEENTMGKKPKKKRNPINLQKVQSS